MKRLIEEDFPIFEVSRESAREKSIRHGHISTLHIWWARRPLAACRAAIFASLVPDPATLTEQIPEYIDFLLDTLPVAPKEKKSEGPRMRARKRLVKFTADISPWEASNNQRLLNKARKIIEVGTAVIKELRKKELTGLIEGKRRVDMPKVLDPFAGGGSIPLEALRLGCEAHAVEYNPVAVLILKATLEYPQKYGEKLVKDVKKWGKWVLEEAKKEVGNFYPEEGDIEQKNLVEADGTGGWVPVGYIWARTITCENPACEAEIPLIRQFWLRRKETSDGEIDWNDSVYLHPVVDKGKRCVNFEVVERRRIEGFNPSKGTRPTVNARGTFLCPMCEATYKSADLRKYGKLKGFGQRMLCVVLQHEGATGKKYRVGNKDDVSVYNAAKQSLEEKLEGWNGENPAVPNEPLPADGTLGFRVNKYGMKTWGELFNARQLLALIVFLDKIQRACAAMFEEGSDPSFVEAVSTYLSFTFDRMAVYNSSQAPWHVTGEKATQAFGRQALPMVWDYVETNPFGPSFSWGVQLDWIVRVIENNSWKVSASPCISLGSATEVSSGSRQVDAVITDPPYYDAVPYADLSDFFYVWLKRAIADLFPGLFATPLTPKSQEAIQEPMRHNKDAEKAKEFYETTMCEAFRRMREVLEGTGVLTIVFAHKTTQAWETLVNALIAAGIVPTSSWPIHTEMGVRLRARDSAALASSFFLACRKREGNETVYFKDIKQELNKRIMERLDHFWEQGIRGADFFISAIGPAVEVFGRYEKVKRLSGEKVSASELLEEVRKLVTQYALGRILSGVKLEKIDPLSRFYILWRWTYNGETIPYDDARKLAQAVGIELDDVRGKGKLVSGKDKITVAKPEERKLDEIAKRQPVSLIDAMHTACLLWKADKRKEMEKFLDEAGFLDDAAFWETAQDLSDLLPDGDREKQMLQGLVMKAPTMRGEAGKQLTLNKEWIQ